MEKMKVCSIYNEIIGKYSFYNLSINKYNDKSKWVPYFSTFPNSTYNLTKLNYTGKWKIKQIDDHDEEIFLEHR